MNQKQGSAYEAEIREVLVAVRLLIQELRPKRPPGPLVSDRTFWTAAGAFVVFTLGRVYTLTAL